MHVLSKILLISVLVFPAMAVKEHVYVQKKEEKSWSVHGLEMNLARDSCRSEN